MPGAKIMKVLNWLNGTKAARTNPNTSFSRSAIEPLPKGDAPLTRYKVIPTSPLSDKLKEEYKRGRDATK